jgi:UDPglucose 6-dehydrogenase/GDP-mannose 6-dehydrogenase
MRVSVIGAGYVGLVSGACLAEKGHNVVCVDVDPRKIDSIRRKVAPFHEAGLPALLERHVGRGLTADTDLRRAVQASDLTLIGVGTPFDGRTIDLSYVRQAAREIGQALRDKNGYHVVVVKSTVIPKTTESVVLPLLEEFSGKKAGADFGVGMNPEFLTEGTAVRDFMEPDRIVLGAIDERSLAVLDRLYEAFPDTPKLRTTPATAEMIKYASNAVLATLISFSNEFANLCSALGGIDVADVMRGVHLAQYFSVSGRDGRRPAPITSFLEAGCGFGGSCLPKDVQALSAQGREIGQPMPLLEAVMQTNRAQPSRMIRILDDHFDSLDGLRVAVLGLAFKPDTDDMRESPAIAIVNQLLSRGAVVKAYDPVANESARRVLPADQIEFAESLESALDGVQAVLLVTRWDEFRQLPDLLGRLDAPPLLVDGRRMLPRAAFRRYDGIGL